MYEEIRQFKLKVILKPFHDKRILHMAEKLVMHKDDNIIRKPKNQFY